MLVDLSVEQADALKNSELLEVRPEFDRWRVLPRGKVGSLRLYDGVQIDVLPKDRVGLSRVLFLLGYANDPGFRDRSVGFDAQDDLWPAMAESLARFTRGALAAGVLQGYVSTDEALRTVRGRIRIADQLARRPGRMIPIEVSYDDYTVDIAENQILRTALRRMLAVPGIDGDSRSRLAHMDSLLEGVRLLTPRERRPSWRPGRLNARYVPALRLAELVLDHMSVEMGKVGVEGVAFAVDMAKVFEDFVGTALTEALAFRPGFTQPQYPSRLDEPSGNDPAISMYVDVVHVVDGNRPSLVFDAKYKAAGPTGQYPNADHYQMLAYSTALSTKRAWLVYAGSGSERTRKVINTDKRIIEFPLDLSLPPAALLRRVQELADSAWIATAEDRDPGTNGERRRQSRKPLLG